MSQALNRLYNLLFLLVILIFAQVSSKENQTTEQSNLITSRRESKRNKVVEERSEEKQEIILGPVLGKVTSTSARILLEFKLSGFVTLVLKSTSKASSNRDSIHHSSSKYVIKGNPALFQFTDLQPGNVYKMKVLTKVFGGERIRSSVLDNAAVTTRNSEYHQNFNIAFVSNNDVRYSLKIPVEQNLWTDIANKARLKKLDLIVHTGNQILADHSHNGNANKSVYYSIRQLMLKIPKKDYHKYTEIVRELLRKEYRRTWSFKPTAIAMSLVPNTMMLDDRDLLSHQAFDVINGRKDSFQYFFANQARYVYYQYQRQLREDVNLKFLENNGPEYFYDDYKDFAVVFLDYRGRIFHKYDGTSIETAHLGKAQTDWYKQLLLRKNAYKALIFVTAVPMFLFSKDTMKKLKINTFLADGHWENQSIVEYQNFLRDLRSWKKKSKGTLMFVGGDIQMGGLSEVYYKQKPFANQLITSGINKDENGYIEFGNLYGESKKQKPDWVRNYCFFHHDFTKYRNYGLVEILSDDKSFSIFARLRTSFLAKGKPKQSFHFEDGPRFNQNKFNFSEESNSCKVFAPLPVKKVHKKRVIPKRSRNHYR